MEGEGRKFASTRQVGGLFPDPSSPRMATGVVKSHKEPSPPSVEGSVTSGHSVCPEYHRGLGAPTPCGGGRDADPWVGRLVCVRRRGRLSSRLVPWVFSQPGPPPLPTLQPFPLTSGVCR